MVVGLRSYLGLGYSLTVETLDAYLEEIEFLVRHRFPRPIAGSMERVVTEPSVAGRRRAVRDGAREALRFLAAIHQAERRARGEIEYVVVPDPRSLRTGYPPEFFVQELAGLRPPAARLMAVAGEPGGGVPRVEDADLDREHLLDALADNVALARYRLLIPGPWDKPYYRGSVVLLGSGLNFYGQAVEGTVQGGEVPAGQPLLCDPRDGRLLSLAPYLRWEPGRTPAEGTLFILTGTEGPHGIYDEVGVVSLRRLKLPLSGQPCELRAPLLPGQSLGVQHPPGRYPDGERFDPHYLIHGLMWRGGVADIYRARLLETGAPVVLKTFEGEADGENRDRFQDEIRFGDRVHHPHVVRIQPARHMPSHLLMEMDYAAGGNLADRLAVAGVLDPYETLEILIDLCGALEAVHTAGVIHLDLKPENVLFTAEGDLRLIDFGISTATSRAPAHLRPGYVVGTPGYIPPERQRGEPLTIQADLWELGVLASQMLTGHLAQTPADVPGADRLHPALGAVLRRLLQERPEDRYDTTRAVLDAFRDAVNQVSPIRAIALDLEGTLLTTACRPAPRPHLRAFSGWCMDQFDRVFVYTAVESTLAWSILEEFQREGFLERRFLAAANLVDWPRGDAGSLKDLRRLELPLPWVVLVDDMASWVATDQRHRWVRIAAYDEPRPGDTELDFIRPRILERFANS